MSLRAPAAAVHYDASYLSKALRGVKPCGPKLARDIDEALAAGGEIIAAAAGSVPTEGACAGTVEALNVMTWITATNASDDAITEFAHGTEYLAEVHGRMPAGKVLGVHRAAQALLRGGRQRIAQTRELLRIDSALLAHACLLYGDLGQYEEARAYGSAALLCAQEAGCDESLAWTAIWSFSRSRQAVFTLSVCTHTGNPDGALRAAADADAYWASGGGKVTATWAQVRAGAAIAYLMKGSLDGAAGQLGPVLELPPDQRIRTVTGYLDEISAMIRAPAFRRQPPRRAAR